MSWYLTKVPYHIGTLPYRYQLECTYLQGELVRVVDCLHEHAGQTSEDGTMP